MFKLKFSTLAMLLCINVWGDSLKSTQNITKGGEQNQKILEDESNIKKVYLERSVVTASGYEQDLNIAPASISVVASQDIQSRPVRDLGEALQNVPGVSIDSGVSKTGGYGISIRGMGSAYTLILIDGKRVNADSSLFPNGFSDSITSFMPPFSMIERIEVIRGPASTLYGSDAIGGVVNIITKNISDKWGLSLSYNYTFQENKAFGNTQGFNFYTAGPLNQTKNWGLSLRGRTYTRDYVPSTNLNIIPTINGTNVSVRRTNIVGLTPAQTYNVGGRLNWYTLDNKNSAYCDVDYSQQGYDNSQGLLGTYNTNETSEAKRKASNGYGAEMNFYRFNAVVAHKGKYVRNPNGTISYLNTDTSLQYNITANPNRYVPTATFLANAASVNGLKTSYGVIAGDSRELTNQDVILDHKINIFFNLGNNFSINTAWGGKYWYNSFKDKVFQATGGKATQTQHIGALFGEGEFILWDRLFLTLGIRGNFSSIFGSNVSPRAYLAYHLINNWLTIKGGISTGYKTPALSNLVKSVANLSRQGQTHTYGNPHLKPESSINYELSILSDNDYFSASLTGFYTDFIDKITTAPSVPKGNVVNGFTCGAMSCSFYTNVGEAISYGAEVILGIKPIDVGYGDISLNAAYTYNYAKITKSRTANQIGTRLTNVPLHSFNTSLNYDINQFGVYIREEIKSGIYRGNPNIPTSPAATLGEFYNPIYLTHLGGYYKFNENLRLNLAVYNLLNTNFVDYSLYNNGTALANAYNYIREGRRYYFSAIMDF